MEALELLSKDILEVYFNIKQLSIQEVERRKLETNLRYLTAVLQPFIKLKQAVSSVANNDGFKGSNLEALWSTERDPVSRQNITYIKGQETGNASVVMDGTNFLMVIEGDPFMVSSGSVVGK